MHSLLTLKDLLADLENLPRHIDHAELDAIIEKYKGAVEASVVEVVEVEAPVVEVAKPAKKKSWVKKLIN